MKCQYKKDLYLLSKITNDINIHQLYKNHCRYLSAVIKSAKKRYYNKLLLSSNNKPLTSWQIIKSATNAEKCKDGISSIIIDGINCNDNLTIAKAFNTHFLTSPLKISSTCIDKSLTKPKNDGPSNYLNQVYNQPFQKIKLTQVTTKEIIELVRLLKSTHSYGYDEIPSLYFSALVADLIIYNDVSGLLLEDKSSLLYLFLADFMAAERYLKWFL